MTKTKTKTKAKIEPKIERAHIVVVWIGSRQGETKQFTATVRNGDGNKARLIEVDEQVRQAGFRVAVWVPELTKDEAERVKREMIAKYTKLGYTYQRRKSLPLPMRG